jgi:hypothetical protein
MTDIDQKARALVADVVAETRPDYTGSPWNSSTILNEALYRAIEQHEAFKQKVSYAIEDVTDRDLPVAVLRRFVIETDPLVDAMTEAFSNGGVWEPCNKADADNLRAALEARGLEIREKSDR